MNFDTLSLVAVVVVLAAFLLWAVMPVLRNNRERILRSPATWALVVLALSFLWLKWEERKIAREMAAFYDSMETSERILDMQVEIARRAVFEEAERALLRYENEEGSR